MDVNSVLDSIRGPVRIIFEPTISCNLRCPMCDRTHKSDFTKHRDDKLNKEHIEIMLRDIGEMGVRHILLIGGGEPLTEPNILHYIDLLKSYDINVHLWTNGTLISEDNAEFLAKQCDMITVSLDSSDPDVNDKSRGVPGSTQKSIAGLKLLRYHNPYLYLRIHSVISALNVDNLTDFVSLAKELSLNEIGGAVMNPFEFVPDNMRLSNTQKAALNNNIEKLRALAHKEGIALAGCYEDISGKTIRKLMREHGLSQNKCVTCLGLWTQATIRPNGDVSVCCFTYKPVLGNLHDASFREIWMSDRAHALREYCKRGNYIDEPCKGCDLGHPVFTRLLEKCGNMQIFNDMQIRSR